MPVMFLFEAFEFLDLIQTLSLIGEHSAFWKTAFFFPIILDVNILAFWSSNWTIQKRKPLIFRHKDYWTCCQIRQLVGIGMAKLGGIFGTVKMNRSEVLAWLKTTIFLAKIGRQSSFTKPWSDYRCLTRRRSSYINTRSRSIPCLDYVWHIKGN